MNGTGGHPAQAFTGEHMRFAASQIPTLALEPERKLMQVGMPVLVDMPEMEESAIADSLDMNEPRIDVAAVLTVNEKKARVLVTHGGILRDF
jgi:hypothetical protein